MLHNKSQRSRLIAFRKRKPHDKRKLKQRKICMAVSDSFSFTYHPRPLLAQLGETFFEEAFMFLFINISRDTLSRLNKKMRKSWLIKIRTSESI